MVGFLWFVKIKIEKYSCKILVFYKSHIIYDIFLFGVIIINLQKNPAKNKRLDKI